MSGQASLAACTSFLYSTDMQTSKQDTDLSGAPGLLDELTPYERLVRLALTALGLLTLLALFCVLPWRGLLAATAQPDQWGLTLGSSFVALRVALRAFPWVAGAGLVVSWGLFAMRQPRSSFYAALVALGLLLITGLTVLVFAITVNLVG